MAALFGNTLVTDAYLMATIVPLLLFDTLNTAITTTFIPVATEYRMKHGQAGVQELSGAVTGVVLFLSILLTIGAEIIAPGIVRLIAPGFSGKAAELTLFFTRIMLPVMIFYGLNGVFTGLLNLNNSFVAPAAATVPFNFLIIASAFFAARTGLLWLGIGTVAAASIQVLVNWGAILHKSLGYPLRLQFSHPGVRRIAMLTLPVIFGSFINELNAVVDRVIASGLPEGSIAALNFANRVVTVPTGVLVVAIGTVLFPSLAREAVSGRTEAFREQVNFAFRLLLFLILPITAGALALSQPIIQMLFQRGAFNLSATITTSEAFFWYSVGLPAYAWEDLSVRAFYAMQNTKLPTFCAGVGLLLNVVLNLTLVRFMAHRCLALATALATYFEVGLELYFLRRKLRGVGGGRILKSVVIAAVGTVIMALIVMQVASWLPLAGHGAGAALKSLLGLVVVGIIVYAAVTYLFRSPELAYLMKTAAEGAGRFLPGRLGKSVRSSILKFVRE
jgi:putative peptidoglycan lipid II flippase